MKPTGNEEAFVLRTLRDLIARGEPAMRKLRDSLQTAGQPLRFTLSEFSLIWRNDPPDDAFRVGCNIRLGKEM